MSKKNSANFEKSINLLEELVSKMEEDSISLNQMLEYYEQGNSLIQDCEKSLESARKQLQTIKAKASHTSPKDASKINDNDENELF